MVDVVRESPSQEVIRAGESRGQTGEVFDVKSGQFKFHWTQALPDRITKLRLNGILSPREARAFGLSDKKPGNPDEDNTVFVSRSLETSFYDPREDIGAVLKDVRSFPYVEGQSEIVPRNITPDHIAAWIIPDSPARNQDSRLSQEEWDEIIRNRLRDIDLANAMLESRGKKPLPVYGTSGNMYGPERLSHEEIQERLQADSVGYQH